MLAPWGPQQPAPGMVPWTARPGLCGGRGCCLPSGPAQRLLGAGESTAGRKAPRSAACAEALGVWAAGGVVGTVTTWTRSHSSKNHLGIFRGPVYRKGHVCWCLVEPQSHTWPLCLCPCQGHGRCSVHRLVASGLASRCSSAPPPRPHFSFLLVMRRVMKLLCHHVSPERIQAVQTSRSPLGPTRSSYPAPWLPGAPARGLRGAVVRVS